MIKFLNYSALFILLVLLQTLLLNHIELGGLINPYFYVLFIILLPKETPKYMLLLLGFALGFIIDIFSNTPGMHAAATTFLAFIRPTVIKPDQRDLNEVNAQPRLSQMSISRFVQYVALMVFSHHIFLFMVEAFSFDDLLFTLLRAVISSIITIVLIIISQLLFDRE
ncbi:MAG: rod shape-determining protein MreD [Bacteroidales bacterium]|jgi:rod shape-determining protein MreD|nr:rod shape-determining protein MreD [Bacteroidales bacterium]